MAASATETLSRTNNKLVLFMDVNTGEVVIEGVAHGRQPVSEMPGLMRMFHTDLPFSTVLATKIRLAIEANGVKVLGIMDKCLDLKKDLASQVLTIIYDGVEDFNRAGFQHDQMEVKFYLRCCDKEHLNSGMGLAQACTLAPVLPAPLRRSEMKSSINDQDVSGIYDFHKLKRGTP